MAEFDAAAVRSLQPVAMLPEKAPEDGIGLCLSGGGYRAMLFHLGALWRLNERGRLGDSTGSRASRAARSPRRRSGCAGGPRVGRDGRAENFERRWSRRVRVMARETIDASSVVEGLLPFTSVGERVAHAYREHLFGEATLQDLPEDGDRPAVRDLRDQPRVGGLVPLLAALPRRLPRRDGEGAPRAAGRRGRGLVGVPADPLAVRARPARRGVGDRGGNDLVDAKWRGEIKLSDGGVYDNLGLETVWRSCRPCSSPTAAARRPTTPIRRRDWPRQVLRVLKVIDNQVRELRKRQAVGSYRAGLRAGTYWGIRSAVADYGCEDALQFDAGDARGAGRDADAAARSSRPRCRSG